MTAQPSLIFDTTVLSHFARADRLDVLSDLVIAETCGTTEVVKQELRQGAIEYPELAEALDLAWLLVMPLDSGEALVRFATWARRMGTAERNLGEASVFAAAEQCGGTVITGDRDAVRVGRAHGLDVHGTIWLLAAACRNGKLTEVSASNLIDTLRATNMRLPCTGAELGSFVRAHGLLP
ncbi:MAG: DUF3368 domain-containing protein [Actinophytocola sp.]|nr:DUF3368 domain-containing protein [Actinophytocola sp.]